jgi:hypothetical protein
MGGSPTEMRKNEAGAAMPSQPAKLDTPYEPQAYDKFYSQKANANDQEMLRSLARDLYNSAKGALSQNFTGRDASPAASVDNTKNK